MTYQPRDESPFGSVGQVSARLGAQYDAATPRVQGGKLEAMLKAIEQIAGTVVQQGEILRHLSAQLLGEDERPKEAKPGLPPRSGLLGAIEDGLQDVYAELLRNGEALRRLSEL